ncbi:unnamed protein product [Ectocarpus sp. CCAP 1310/34]|nr:unnamed protein product [Ectocarpus sp. CCAP 1310/34]
MTKRGRRVPTVGTNGRPPKAIKGANAAAVRNAKAMNKLLDDMEKREAATAAAEAALAAKEEEVKAMKASVARDQEKLARDIARSDALQQQRERREQDRVSKVAEAATSKLPPLALKFVEDSVQSLRPKTGELTTLQQSRMILMLYFDLVKGGSSENHAKEQVFRRTVKDYLECSYGLEMSNRAVGRLLQRLGFKHRRGRIKIPPLNEERKNRIRLFLVKMDLAKRAEGAGVAVIVYMDESFVHQAHGSAYSYFPSDDTGVMQDGIGRTTGKGLRMIMVHAIAKHGPLAELQERFPIREGWFKAKENRAKKINPGEADFEMSDEQTAEFLWQAKLATGDYHNAMTDGMFMQWLKHRLTPAFDAQFKNKKMFLVLDNASYHHHCFDEELKVMRESEGKAVEYNFEVPAHGSLPNANGKNGVCKEEIASVTRTHFKNKFPQKLEEKAETCMREKGWGYMPTFQPIELFWQHGKQYVSIHFEKGRNMLDVGKQTRLGWYGDPEWDGQEGGWKAANCGKLVEHAIGKMNEWIGLYGGNLSGTIGSLEYPVAEYREATAEDEIEDGVEEQTDEWLGEDAEDAIEG